MKLTSRSELGLRAMIELARCPEGELSATAVALRCQASVPFMGQVLLALRIGGLVTGRRGRSGGYRLTRRPSEITVGEILRSLDGEVGPTPCANSQNTQRCTYCEPTVSCQFRPLWLEVASAITSILDQKTLADYVRAPAPVPAETFG